MAGACLRGDRIAIAGRLAAAWLVAVLALMAVHVFVPQRSGVIALTQVFEPYIVVVGLVAVAVALASRWRPAAYIAAVFLVVTLGRYLPGMVSFPAPPQSDTIKVVAWNVLAAPDAADRLLDGLLPVAADADLVGLVELQPPMADALATDPTLAERFPHRVLDPDRSVYGVGLISRDPIIEQTSSHEPPYLRAVVNTRDTPAPTVVYVVHPLPARIRTVGDLPVSLDTTRRDRDMEYIRSLIEADLASGRQVVVMGDINTTEREPAYSEFASGLRDAHLDAGIGPGLTWRPGWLPSPPFGVLRIDYVFFSPFFRATSSTVSCPPLSDHCLVIAELDRAGVGERL